MELSTLLLLAAAGMGLWALRIVWESKHAAAKSSGAAKEERSSQG